MLKKHRDQFAQILSLVGRKRPYFTRNAKELVEINVSANRIATLSRRIIELFGYPKDVLSFNVERLRDM